ncbi:MAG: hypothetical protein J6S67_15035 [Methanobrevibacter sp.]|nr:hypothetical protein [Methanobrevibacter sp.]
MRTKKKPNEIQVAEQARNEISTPFKLPEGLKNTDNVNYTLHNLDIVSLPPINARLCSAEALQKRCFEYLQICIRNNMKPSLAGLALVLDVSRQTLIDYITGASQIPKDNEQVLRRFHGFLNALLEDYMQNGKMNPVTAIFIAKNNFGYKDAQEYIVNNATQEASPESLIEEANLLLEDKE